MLIDGKVGFTGGVNLADEYINEIERFGRTSFSQDDFVEPIAFDKFEIEFLREEKRRSADPRNDFGSGV